MPAPAIAEVLETSDNRTTSQTLTTSAATAAGDTLLIIYGSDFYTLANMPDPTSTAGALSLAETVDIGDNIGHIKAYLCTVGTAGAKDVTIPAHIDCDIHGVVIRLTGEVLVDVDGGNFDPGNNTDQHVAPSVTTTGADRLLVCAWLTTAGPVFTGEPYVVPAGMVKRGETGASPFSDMCLATQQVSNAEATGTRTATWIAPRRYGALTVALAVPAPPSVGAATAGIPRVVDNATAGMPRVANFATATTPTVVDIVTAGTPRIT